VAGLARDLNDGGGLGDRQADEAMAEVVGPGSSTPATPAASANAHLRQLKVRSLSQGEPSGAGNTRSVGLDRGDASRHDASVSASGPSRRTVRGWPVLVGLSCPRD
jgi:hypothetical protein